MRSVLLATLTLLLTAAPASAALTVDMNVAPREGEFRTATKVTGTVLLDGAPAAGQAVQLEGKPYPFDGEAAVLASTTTAADGTFAFSQELTRNTVLQVRAAGARSKRVRAYVFPATDLSFRARNSRVITVTQRYIVPRGVKLKQPTIFYVGKRGAARAPRAASADLVRTKPGRYRSTATVRIPAAWKGRFRYASCFRYTAGSGMGNPRAGCPQNFRF